MRIVDQVAAGYVIEWEGYPDPGEYTTEPADVVEAADRGFSSAMAVWRRASKKTSGKKARRKSPNEMLMVNNREKRKRKSTTVTVDGQAVLKLNNYSMEDGEAGRREGACSYLEPPAKPAAKKSAYIFFCTQQSGRGECKTCPERNPIASPQSPRGPPRRHPHVSSNNRGGLARLID